MAKRPSLHFEEGVFDEVFYTDLDYVVRPTSRKAFFLILGIALVVVGAALGKTGFLLIGRGAFYAARAEINVNREIRLPTYRAVIIDRFGKIVVENKASFTAFISMPIMMSENDALKRVLGALSRILATPEENLEAIVEEANLNEDNWVPIARDISTTEAIAIRALHEASIEVLDDYKRVYADSSVFAHLTGYTGVGEGNRIVGVSGVERAYDTEIRGEDGRSVLYQDAIGSVVGRRAIEEPKPAEPLRLTIDAEFQKFFYTRFAQGLTSLGRKAGVGIALDPRNGEILSLVSFPSFDANVFVDRAAGPRRALLLTDSTEPLFNRAVSGAYSPGSTIKPLVALAALKAGVIDPLLQVFSDGSLEIPNPYDISNPSHFLDWRAHGWVDVRSALARSSNIFFYLAGGGLPKSVGFTDLVQGNFLRSGLGIEGLHTAWERFGFGKKTGIDVPYESTGFLPSIATKKERGGVWRLGDTYNVSIGQGDLLVTPLQLISFFASLGMDGKIYRPFVRFGSEPQVLTDYGADFKNELPIVQEGLRDVVREPYGTAYLFHDLPFSVSGKTGSAQTNNNTRVNALFLGFAPSENPEIALLILVENAREGSANTMPIAKDVLQWYYEHRISKSN
jgi:penicillin-binding protein 2